MLHLHRAERADRLVEVLSEILAVPPPDPFTPDVIAVPARGIERWLTQELSGRLGARDDRADGIAANIDFPFPATLVGWALAAAVALEPTDDPWNPSRLVWPLLDVLDDPRHDAPWLEALRRNIGADGDPVRAGRRFSAARHIADLFDRYAVHRPEMVRAWVAGRDVGSNAKESLGPTDAWQPQLWRLLRKRIEDVASPAERIADTVTALRDGLAVPSLPDRFSLFGLTALPASHVEIFQALAAHREVHVFALHPSAPMWAAVSATTRRGPKVRRRDDDRSRVAAVNPLLASWGRDVRELQLVLAAAGTDDGDHRGLVDPRDTLLHRIQNDVRSNRAPATPRADQLDVRPTLDPGDRTLQIHACHGRTRQVEVLRDAVLHLLADDPSLEPRDVLVMCPDIETYAPLVSAVFGAQAVSEEGEAPEGALPDLRVRLADRAIRQVNPVLRVVSELLHLADARLTATEVLDLAGREPVRRRFAFDDDGLGRLESWTASAGIRWGLDADHRAAFGLGTVGENSWRTGLDRILLGVVMADEDDRLVGGVCPLDDVPESDSTLAGRLAELVDRLDVHLAALRRPQTVREWAATIGAAAKALTAVRERDAWQMVQLDRLLGGMREEATVAGADSAVELSLAEVRSLLDDRLRGRPTRANHRTGDMTVCTMVPMRSVPHRVICLLGLDEGTFPRRTVGDGDDLLDRDPYVGDRDPRTEDRQLLLDALLAATNCLVVTYTGRDVRTNERKPPAVPIGELIDVVDRTVRLADPDKPARTKVVTEHPLQPFDPRNFTPDALGRREPWGFDRTQLTGAQALAAGDRPARQFLTEPLDAAARDDLALEDLITFFEHPVKAFLRRRLDIHLPSRSDEPAETIPVELDPLERYSLGDRLLGARRAGADPDRWAAAERARGTLPPGALAQAELDGVTDSVEALLTAAAEHVDGRAERTSLDVGVALPDGRRLLGTVPDITDATIVAVRYSRLGAKHRLRAWVSLLAATATHPEQSLRAVTVGRCRPGIKNEVSVSTLGPLGDDAEQRRKIATELLVDLVDLHDAGLREPLPLYCKSSAAWAENVWHDRDGETGARKQWITGGGKFPNEDSDPYHQLVLGGVLPYDELDDRFCELAHRLWDPLLACESVEDCG